MRTQIILLISTLLVVMAAPDSFARPQAGPGADDPVSGLYQGVAKMPAGSKDLTFVVEIKNLNGTLSGHAEVEGHQLPLTGSYSRGTLTLKLKPGAELTITANVKPDRITGTWEMEGGNTGGLEMKRVSSGWKQVHEMIARARADLAQFVKAGATGIDRTNPAGKWAEQLLAYARQHSGAPESKDAENEAVHLLLRAGMIADAATSSAQLDSSGELWAKQVTNEIWTANAGNDHDYVIRNAQALIDHSQRPELKAQIRLAQGDAYWDKADPARAKDIFRRVIDENPKTRFAEEARGDIYEIEKLNVGQTAPGMESKFVDGHHATLADYKGKTVLLVFWASW
jgi:hypothetical protein